MSSLFVLFFCFFDTRGVFFDAVLQKNAGYFTSLPSVRWKERLGDQVAIGSTPQRGSFL